MSNVVDETQINKNLHNINDAANIFKLLIKQCQNQLKLFEEIDKINYEISKNKWNNYNAETLNAIRFEKYCTMIFLYGIQQINSDNNYSNFYPKFTNQQIGLEICTIKQDNFLRKYYNMLLGEEYCTTFSKRIEKIITTILNCQKASNNVGINGSNESKINNETELEEKTMRNTNAKRKLNLPTINNFEKEKYTDLTFNNPNRYFESNIFHRRDSIKKNMFDTNLLILPKQIDKNKINNIHDIQNEINYRIAIQNSNQINATRYVQYAVNNSVNNNHMIKLLSNYVNDLQATVSHVKKQQLSVSNNNNNNCNSNLSLVSKKKNKNLKNSNKQKRQRKKEEKNKKRNNLVQTNFGGYCKIANACHKLNLNVNNDNNTIHIQAPTRKCYQFLLYLVKLEIIGLIGSKKKLSDFDFEDLNTFNELVINNKDNNKYNLILCNQYRNVAPDFIRFTIYNINTFPKPLRILTKEILELFEFNDVNPLNICAKICYIDISKNWNICTELKQLSERVKKFAIQLDSTGYDDTNDNNNNNTNNNNSSSIPMDLTNTDSERDNDD